MSEHTPGPWDFWPEPIGPGYRIRKEIDGGENRLIVGHVLREENARLIAAAPDLLQALQDVMDDYCTDEDCGARSCKAARDAIAKATIPATERS